MQILKDAFERVKTKKNECDAVSFFLQTRKYPPLKQLSSTLARDPEGTSRIPRETFQ